MVYFKNKLAKDLSSLAAKVEKLSIERRKIKDMEILEKMCSLEEKVDKSINSLISIIDEIDEDIKLIKKRGK